MRVWLSKKAVDGTFYTFLNRSFSRSLAAYTAVRVALWSSNTRPTIATSPHNWRLVYVSAGDPGSGDAYVYKSVNGGATFVATAVELMTSGGQVWWNWSTSTPNAKNTLESNLFIVRGRNASNALLFRRGPSGSDVTIATGAGKEGATAFSLYGYPRDLDFLYMASQDNAFYKSTNTGASWSATTSVPGGTSNITRGVIGFPRDSNFALAFGYRTLAYSTNAGTAWTNLWTGLAAALGGGDETVVSAVVDLSVAFRVAVAYE
jgi:hypothetical protein